MWEHQSPNVIQPNMDLRFNMFTVGLLFFVMVKQTMQQSPTLTKYKRILVTSDSFNKMKIKNYIDDGSDRMRQAYTKLRILKRTNKVQSWVFDHIHNYRLSNIMCGSICSTDDVCNAYKYLPRNCSLVNATGLIGAEKSSPAAETVMINQDLVAGRASPYDMITIYCHLDFM